MFHFNVRNASLITAIVLCQLPHQTYYARTTTIAVSTATVRMEDANVTPGTVERIATSVNQLNAAFQFLQMHVF